MLVRQAAETTKSLPKGKVSATEYYEIGTAMMNAYDFVDALQFFELARDSANGFNDDVGATRSIAMVNFYLDKVSDGRTAYQHALEIFSKYPSFSQDVKDTTNAYTEMAWCASEANTFHRVRLFHNVALSRVLGMSAIRSRAGASLHIAGE